MELSKTRKLAYIALLIALAVVMGRFVGIMTPVVAVNFSFLPLIVNAVVFGPIASTVSAAAADVIGAVLFPQGLGTFFPGYTLSAAFTGLIYGLVLYRKPRQLWRVSLACLINGIVVSIGINTYWVYMMTGKGYLLLLPTRIVQNAVLIPIRIFVIWAVAYPIIPVIWKGWSPERLKPQENG